MKMLINHFGPVFAYFFPVDNNADCIRTIFVVNRLSVWGDFCPESPKKLGKVGK